MCTRKVLGTWQLVEMRIELLVRAFGYALHIHTRSESPCAARDVGLERVFSFSSFLSHGPTEPLRATPWARPFESSDKTEQQGLDS